MWVVCLGLGACIATSPEQAAQDALGPERPGESPGPYHRAGQPCLVCHSHEHNPGGLIYEVAGTVNVREGQVRGARGVEVILTDAEGTELHARTNQVGTFFVRVSSQVSEPQLRGYDGQLLVPRAPVFPLRVRIRQGQDEQAMQGMIWREGSCAQCHQETTDEGSNGPIFLRGVP
jgi:hypothetical protein